MSNISNDTVSDAVVHDAKFMAVLDCEVYDGSMAPAEYKAERRTYWTDRLQNPADGDQVLIARIGALCAAYSAQQTLDGQIARETVIPSRHRGKDVIKQLLKRAGVSEEDVGQTHSSPPVLERV